MATGQSTMLINGNNDNFCFGMLNKALDELDELSTTRSIKDGYKQDSKMENIESTTTSMSIHYGSQFPHFLPVSPHDVFKLTNRVVNSKFLHHIRSHLSSSSRASPYMRRKPLYTLKSRTISSCSRHHQRGGFGCLKNGNYKLRSLQTFSCLPKAFENLDKKSYRVYSFSTTTELNGQNWKKDYSSAFPVPVLTRSKSLEDLRESDKKPKLKSVTSDLSNNSFSTSLLTSPSRTPKNTISSFQLRKDCEIQVKGYERDAHQNMRMMIGTEIDSMSLRIGNLNVK